MNRPGHRLSKATLREFRARKLAFFDAMVRDGGLTILDLRLTWRLIDRLNPESGESWPSLKTVASELGCNLRALKRAEKRLEMKGWFLVRRGGGRGRSNHYIPNWQKIIEDRPSNTTAKPETVADEIRNSGSPVPETVAGQPPESVMEPLYESVGANYVSALKRGEPTPTTPSWRQIDTAVTNRASPIARQDDHQSAEVWERWIDWLYREGRYNAE